MKKGLQSRLPRLRMPLSTLRLPPFQGLRIGLLGGSFNPPHAGHLALAQEACRRLGLDFVWWLVAARNPLKETTDPGDLHARMAMTRQMARAPCFRVLDLEARLGVTYTADLLRRLSPVLERGRFVWLMGADTFATLHFWKDWQMITARLPIAVFARPEWTERALFSPAAHILRDARIPVYRIRMLPDMPAPAWAYVEMPHRAISSSALRDPAHFRPGETMREISLARGLFDVP